MKTMTVEQFKKAVREADWERSDGFSAREVFQGQIFGLAWVDHDSSVAGVRYIEGFCIKDGAISARKDDVSQNWQIEAIKVVDENGVTLTDNQVGGLLGRSFSEIDYKRLKP